jgi:hypothetical protein
MMLRRFQVFYKVPADPSGAVRDLFVHAPTPEAARALIEADGSAVVQSIGPGAPVVDWSQPVFTKEEAAAYLRVTPSTLDQFAARGELPRSKSGFPRYSRATLDRLLTARMSKEAA